MMSIGAIKSAAAASVYFEKDDYYIEDGSSPSAWIGSATESLGFTGGSNHSGEHALPVERDTFRAALGGEMPDGTRLGTHRNGEFVHRPGWDLTFSAPKSVSILAEVARDQRVIAAHDRAVRATMTMVEARFATTRVRDEKGEIQHVRTGALAAASFRHDTSRSQEPQLHTHVVVMNATITPDGKARSLEPQPIYAAQKDIGAYYRAHLAAELGRLGYEVEWGQKDRTTFEVRGVPKELMQVYSTRSAEIEAALAAKGLTRETATPREAEYAAKDTRRRKETIDRPRLLEHWQGTAAEHGVRLDRLVAQAGQRAPEPSRREIAERQAALQSVQLAIAVLADRDAVFSRDRLRREAQGLATGAATPAQVEAAIRRSAEQGLLLPRTAIEVDLTTRRDAQVPGWTTPQAIETERVLLQSARDGQGILRPILSAQDSAAYVARAEAVAQRAGFSWTADQSAAARGILASQDRVTAVQGFAGTAKTTTVLATYAEAAKARGYEVIAMAPTANAANVLGEALGIEGRTVHRHFEEMRRDPQNWSQWTSTLIWEGRAARMPSQRQVWLIDEASLIGSRNMQTLLTAAEERRARVVLVGDDKQLASVEAGRAFGQLQASGAVTTHRLETIVRQTDPQAREAVYASLQRDAGTALRAIEQGKGRLLVGKDGAERIAVMVDRWQALTVAERSRTLLIDPSREGRDAANLEIRDRLIREGSIEGKEAQVVALRPKDLTPTEARLVRSYTAGDVVRFNQDQGAGSGFDWRSYHTVISRDVGSGSVLLRGEDNRLRQFQPEAARADKGQFEVLETVVRGLRAGDEIRWTRNDRSRGIANGSQAQVLSVDPRRDTATVRLANGHHTELNLKSPGDNHWDYAWVRTGYSAQGATADRVIAHAESWRLNLVNARSFYVSISRAKEEITLVTDNPEALVAAIRERAGGKQTAMSLPEVRAMAPGLQFEAQAVMAPKGVPLQEKGSALAQTQNSSGATASPRQSEKSKDLRMDFGLE
ncbi:MobF family relaxase [Pseudoroseomonas sp. WGS1072]|uniref:MobF family relaxase n=1 Tax=Roseomonas sp. WGS1072 TaxID=3366816 RepID=UPI003BF2EAB7